jgi:hypothetical protein
VLQDVLAPKKFTTTIDSVSISEEMIAEGMVDIEASHPDKDLLTSTMWGSYFYCPREPAVSKVAATATSLRKLSSSATPSTHGVEIKKALSLRRVSSMKTPADIMEAAAAFVNAGSVTPILSVAAEESTNDITPPPPVFGPQKINTLWGSLIRDHARMCIPDLDVLVDYPIDYRFPSFGRDKHGRTMGSGFFPADPKSLHTAAASMPRQ